MSLIMPPLGMPAVSAQEAMPPAGMRLQTSPVYAPAVLKGLTLFPDQPFHFKFIIDTGESRLDGPSLKAESVKLIKFFLAALTIPDEDLWVNLSPYERDRMIPEALGQTEMGRALLAQDYVLKQLAASLAYPEEEPGRTFWARVYARARARYGNIDIPVSTFNKVWIVPDRALIYADGPTAMIARTHLKVMLEEDYLARSKAPARPRPEAENRDIDRLSSEVVREVIVPELEREVNEGRHFAPLRQVYHSMLLAVWFKRTVREGILSQVYTDQKKIAGVASGDPEAAQKIYDQYLAAFKKGVFNYIKEEHDPLAGAPVPRKYFSGGVDGMHVTYDTTRQAGDVEPNKGPLVVADVQTDGVQARTEIPLTPYGYQQDIAAGMQTGLIHVSALYGTEDYPQDDYAPDTILDQNQNTRPLSQDAARVAAAVFRQGPARLLELGPGVGKAVGEFLQLGQQSGHALEVHTAGLSPLAPHLALKRTYEDIEAMIFDYAREHPQDNWPELNLFLALKQGGVEMGVPLTLAFYLQQQGLDIFEQRDDFISQQFIGEFLDDSTGLSGPYEFVYDNRGGWYYTIRDTIRRTDEKDLAYEKIFRLLDPKRGLFYAEYAAMTPVDLSDMGLLPEDNVFLFDRGAQKLLAFHRDSIWFGRLKDVLGQSEKIARNIYGVNMAKVVDQLDTPMDAPLTWDAYQQAITAGVEAGTIRLSPERPAEDAYGPEVILEENSRQLLPMVRDAVTAVFKTAAQPRVLELGPGMGNASHEMIALARDAGKDVVLDTTGLSTIAPDIVLGKTVAEIEEMLRGYLQQNPDAELEGLKAYQTRQSKNQPGFPLKLAFALQERGYDIFRKVQDTGIAGQYVGTLMDRGTGMSGGYDWIYDRIGGFFYTIRPNGKALPGLIRPALKRVAELLGAEGIFYAQRLPAFIGDFVRAGMSTDYVVVLAKAGADGLLMMPKDSRWHQQLAAFLKGQKQLAENIYEADMPALLAAMKDASVSMEAEKKSLGGIDLNPAGLNLEIQATGQRMLSLPVDPVQWQNIRIDGLAPVILNLTPVPSLNTLLRSSVE